MPKLSVVVPTYNEADNIGPLLQELHAALQGVDAEVLVVDDDSPDGTADAARVAGARVVVRRGERGLATAILRGFREASGDFVAVMDGDGQHPAAAVRALFERARENKLDLAIGSRYVEGGSDGDFGALRRLISRGAASLALALPPVRRFGIRDSQSGLFLVRRDKLDLGALEPRGYKMLLEVLAKTPLARVEEVGYRFGSRRGGDSKLSAGVMWQYLLHVTTLAALHPENRRVFRFGAVGLSGVFVNLGLLYFLTDRVGLYYLLSGAISVEASIVSNFLLNDRFTFHDRRRGHLLHRMLRFNVVSLAAMAVNLTTLWALTDLAGFHYLVSEAFAIVVAFAANYVGNMQWTYGGDERFQLRRTLAPYAPWFGFALVVGGALLLYGTHVDDPDTIYFDEHYYVTVARQMDNGVWEDPCWSDHRPLNYEHPPLGKLLIAASVIYGDSSHTGFEGCRSDDNPHYETFKDEFSGRPWAWRGPSIAMGVMAVAFLYLAAWRLFESHTAGFLAGSLLLMDNMMFSSARLAILDIFAAGFTAAAVYFATGTSRRSIFLSALFLGFGFASKYTVVFVGPPLLLFAMWRNWRAGTLTRRRFDLLILVYPLTALAVWILAYAPWWNLWIHERGLSWSVQHFYEVTKNAVTWGTVGDAGHKYESPPWEWLTMQRPVFYYRVSNVGGVAGLNKYVYAIGNPILWWLACLAIVLTVWESLVRMVRRMRPWGAGGLEPILLSSVLFLGGYGAFFLVQRATFLFYMTLLVPLLVLPLAGWLARLWKTGGAWERTTVGLSVLLVLAAFLWYYPIGSATVVTDAEFSRIMGTVPWMET